MSTSETICFICDKKFSKKSNLYQHQRNIHRAGIVIEGKFACPIENCFSRFTNKHNLINHLSVLHAIEIETENLNFRSKKEFLAWKKNMEYVENAFYTLKATKNMSNGCKKVYYVCNRSGPATTSKSTGKRMPKSSGSRKCGFRCPSSIEALEDADIKVLFLKTHIGHDKDITHLPLRRSMKEKKENNSEENISAIICMDDIQGTVTNNFEREYKSIVKSNCFGSLKECGSGSNKSIQAKLKYALSLVESASYSLEKQLELHKMLDSFISKLNDAL